METKKGFNKFTTAIANNNINLVKKLVNKHNINNSYIIDGKIYTPLTLAIAYGNAGIIEELLENEHIDINKVDNGNNTPLITAINYNDLSTVEKLIKKSDIKINQADGSKNTPLTAAIKIGNIEIVKKLLEIKSIDINQKDKNGIAPIMYAVLQDRTEIIEQLLRKMDLDITKPEENEELLYEAILSKNNLNTIKLFVNYLNSTSNKSLNNSLLLDLAIKKNNNEIINFLIENLNIKYLEQIKKENIPKILENIKNRKNPDIKLFNLLIAKIDESERKKYLETIKDINKNKQGKNQVTINKEFILNKETGLIEIREVAYAKIKDKDNSSKILYETIYNEDGSKTVIHYKADKEEILFTEIIKENKITKIEFNKNDFEKINKVSKDENERKNKIINYFRDETIKIYNIDYQSIDAFDDTLSRMNYAQTYLGEYLDNKEQNISFGLNLTEIDTNSIKQIEIISEEFTKINNNKIEYISDKIIESSNLENKDKTFIFDLGYVLNPDKISIENIGHFGSHTTQIVISDGKAIMINTGGDKKFDKEFIKQINEKVKKKSNNTQNSIENFNNMFQLKEFGVCNVVSKIYLNILFTEYKKHFGNLSKITEKMFIFQKALKNLNKKSKEEIKKCFEEKGRKKINEIKELGDIIKNTNNIVKRDYKNYFSEENKEFTKFSNTLDTFIKEFDKETEMKQTTEQNKTTPVLY